MRKAKPKNLNLNDLNPVIMRAWVNFEEFSNPGQAEITQRCKLEQVIEDPNNNDIPKPNLEKSYILITVKINPPIQPLVTELQPKISDLVQGPPPIPKLTAAKECINEFKNELQLAMESLAIEYSTMFAKELNGQQEQKSKTIITQQKKQEIQKRKEAFLYGTHTPLRIKEKWNPSILSFPHPFLSQTQRAAGWGRAESGAGSPRLACWAVRSCFLALAGQLRADLELRD